MLNNTYQYKFKNICNQKECQRNFFHKILFYLSLSWFQYSMYAWNTIDILNFMLPVEKHGTLARRCVFKKKKLLYKSIK